jgi:cap1 methyltransferase
MDVSPTRRRHQPTTITLAKRKREEGRYAAAAVDHDDDRGARPPSLVMNPSFPNRDWQTTIADKDIFQQAMSGTLDTTITQNGCICCCYSSWFTSIHSWTRHSVQREPKRHYGVVPLQQQIQATQQQLLQIKRNFASAAQACARRRVHRTSTCSSSSSSPDAADAAALEFNEARAACNPFERLEFPRRLFLNRAGAKLANINALVDFSLIQPYNGEFSFVDLCGAPGGFSEYICNTCTTLSFSSVPSLKCHGWGMSLVGQTTVNHHHHHGHGGTCSWKLRDFDSDTVRYRICHGQNGTGDVCHWPNVEFLAMQIIANHDHRNKVHLVVADGGLDAQRNADCQERVALPLVVCQASAALFLLREGGTLVLKMFGFQTTATKRVMRYMLHVFDNITVLKPITSRPASAERYVVFQGYKGTPLDFNGPQWQSDMLSSSSSSSSSNHDSHHRHDATTMSTTTTTMEEENDDNFNHVLDECDFDLLQLNQKACFEILSYMERKALGKDGTTTFGDDMAEPQPPSIGINMMAYKQEWRL